MHHSTRPDRPRAIRRAFCAFALALSALHVAHASDSAATAATTGSPAVPAAVADLLREYERAWTARDVKRLADLFAPDGMALPNGQAPAAGRPAIEEAYRESAGGSLQLRPLHYTALGDAALVVGLFAPGPQQPEMGKFVLVLRRSASGAWKIVADMDNLNVLPKRPPAPDRTGS